MSIQIHTQPFPEHVAEACAWLSAAERHRAPRQPTRLRDRVTAAEALNILLDVDPPYPAIDTTKSAAPLAEAAARAISTLEAVMRGDCPATHRLRFARALRHLHQSPTMTSYEADLERLAAQLARMIADPVTTTAAIDPRPVNRARLGVRLWCRHVLNDLLPAQPDEVIHEPGLTDLALHPVATLRTLLQHDPQPLHLRAREIRSTEETPPRSPGTHGAPQTQRPGRTASTRGPRWPTSPP